DPKDNLLYGYSKATGNTPLGRGFAGEAVNVLVSAGGFDIGSISADAAGNVFVLVVSTGVDFGLGTVNGPTLLHYDPSGTLVSDTLPAPKPFLYDTVTVGALGDLFYVTGAL